MPSGVRGLEEYVRVAAVVAHDENDVACTASAGAHCLGKVDSGGRISGNSPRCGDGPVTAVHESGCRVLKARGLVLQRRLLDRRHLAGPISAVVAHAIDIKTVIVAVRIDLKVNGLTRVDADVGSKPLDAWITCSVDVPLAGRTAWQTILRSDLVSCRCAGIARHRRECPWPNRPPAHCRPNL